MPLVPNLLERLLLRFQPQLGTFFEIWGAGGFETLLEASHLGVFEAIKDGFATPRELARRIRCFEHDEMSEEWDLTQIANSLPSRRAR